MNRYQDKVIEELNKCINEDYGIIKRVNLLHCIKHFPIYIYISEMNGFKKVFYGVDLDPVTAKATALKRALGYFYSKTDNNLEEFEFEFTETIESAINHLYKNYLLYEAMKDEVLICKKIVDINLDWTCDAIKKMIDISELKFEFYLCKNNVVIMEGSSNNVTIHGVGVGFTIEESLYNAQISFLKNCNLYNFIEEGLKLNIQGNINYSEIDNSYLSKKDKIIKKVFSFNSIFPVMELNIFGMKMPKMCLDNEKKLFPERFINIEMIDIVPEGINETPHSHNFHEASKLKELNNMSDFMYDISNVSLKLKSLTTKSWTNNLMLKEIMLPNVNNVRTEKIENVIWNRRSYRDYTGEPMKLIELSRILFYTYGITGEIVNKHCDNLPLRAVPSGGALYANEINIIVQNVEGVDKGIYRYNPKNNSLMLISRVIDSNKLGEISGYKDMIVKASAIVVLSAFMPRNQWKYKERGYRIMHIDCGHIAQNIHLLSTTDRLGSCCIMGFVDEMLDKILGIDGLQEKSMYMITIGVREKS
ncbi:SagB/ThcOx family dehydrogenase [Clostridium perfringens]|uniref:SagB/ThcOx family dehydrogenase n=1 Tax=Clostridium perfringens TaxID=1502 RepID=UPI00111DDD4A|nr:SagB/ThcOx family dehydrogenase [Clostridium perfringens]TPE20463.1 SagB/ThcOx family dehydrogenase [Clostridium perfringens]